MLYQHNVLLPFTGDEYAQTRGGNNNWYGHDTKLTRFDWTALEAVRDTFFRFYRCSSMPADSLVMTQSACNCCGSWGRGLALLHAFRIPCMHASTQHI